jgi:hypothetical protein
VLCKLSEPCPRLDTSKGLPLEARQELVIAFITKIIGDVIAEATSTELIPPKRGTADRKSWG